MMMIRQLSNDVRGQLRIGVTLTNITQCVEELVLNSVDAGATCVAVRTDIHNMLIQVVDNGMGIAKEQFPLVGTRYCTSKCHIIEDLDNLKCFGYRGEALASLCSASSFVEIVTRPKGSAITYSKCFHKGKQLSAIKPAGPRPGCGTTVTVHNLFYNLPVRKKSLNEGLELEKIRFRIAGLALMWPLISFSLRDDVTGNVILQTHKCSGVLATFSSLFGSARAKHLREVKQQSDQFKVWGFVSRENYSRKDLQFVFVNKRLVLKSKVHKILNTVLSKSILLRRRVNIMDKSGKQTGQDRGHSSEVGSPVNQFERHAVYVINIDCPLSVYDITFDPAKTLVEFQEWSALTKLIETMLLKFLKEENLFPLEEERSAEDPGIISSIDDTSLKSPDHISEGDDPFAGADDGFDEELHKNLEKKRYTQGISTHNILNSLSSHIVRRQRVDAQEEGLDELNPSCAKKNRQKDEMCNISSKNQLQQQGNLDFGSPINFLENCAHESPKNTIITGKWNENQSAEEHTAIISRSLCSELVSSHNLREAPTPSIDKKAPENPFSQHTSKHSSEKVIHQASTSSKQVSPSGFKKQVLPSDLSLDEICLPYHFAQFSPLNRLRARLTGNPVPSLASSRIKGRQISSTKSTTALQKFKRAPKQNNSGKKIFQVLHPLEEEPVLDMEAKTVLPTLKKPLMYKSKPLDVEFSCNSGDKTSCKLQKPGIIRRSKNVKTLNDIGISFTSDQALDAESTNCSSKVKVHHFDFINDIQTDDFDMHHSHSVPKLSDSGRVAGSESLNMPSSLPLASKSPSINQSVSSPPSFTQSPAKTIDFNQTSKLAFMMRRENVQNLDGQRTEPSVSGHSFIQMPEVFDIHKFQSVHQSACQQKMSLWQIQKTLHQRHCQNQPEFYLFQTPQTTLVSSSKIENENNVVIQDSMLDSQQNIKDRICYLSEANLNLLHIPQLPTSSSEKKVPDGTGVNEEDWRTAEGFPFRHVSFPLTNKAYEPKRSDVLLQHTEYYTNQRFSAVEAAPNDSPTQALIRGKNIYETSQGCIAFSSQGFFPFSAKQETKSALLQTHCLELSLSPLSGHSVRFSPFAVDPLVADHITTDATSSDLINPAKKLSDLKTTRALLTTLSDFCDKNSANSLMAEHCTEVAVELIRADSNSTNLTVINNTADKSCVGTVVASTDDTSSVGTVMNVTNLASSVIVDSDAEITASLVTADSYANSNTKQSMDDSEAKNAISFVAANSDAKNAVSFDIANPESKSVASLIINDSVAKSVASPVMNDPYTKIVVCHFMHDADARSVASTMVNSSPHVNNPDAKFVAGRMVNDPDVKNAVNSVINDHDGRYNLNPFMFQQRAMSYTQLQSSDNLTESQIPPDTENSTCTNNTHTYSKEQAETYCQKFAYETGIDIDDVDMPCFDTDGGQKEMIVLSQCFVQAPFETSSCWVYTPEDCQLSNCAESESDVLSGKRSQTGVCSDSNMSDCFARSAHNESLLVSKSNRVQLKRKNVKIQNNRHSFKRQKRQLMTANSSYTTKSSLTCHVIGQKTRTEKTVLGAVSLSVKCQTSDQETESENIVQDTASLSLNGQTSDQETESENIAQDIVTILPSCQAGNTKASSDNSLQGKDLPWNNFGGVQEFCSSSNQLDCFTDSVSDSAFVTFSNVENQIQTFSGTDKKIDTTEPLADNVPANFTMPEKQILLPTDVDEQDSEIFLPESPSLPRVLANITSGATNTTLVNDLVTENKYRASQTSQIQIKNSMQNQMSKSFFTQEIPTVNNVFMYNTHIPASDLSAAGANDFSNMSSRLPQYCCETTPEVSGEEFVIREMCVSQNSHYSGLEELTLKEDGSSYADKCDEFGERCSVQKMEKEVSKKDKWIPVIESITGFHETAKANYLEAGEEEEQSEWKETHRNMKEEEMLMDILSNWENPVFKRPEQKETRNQVSSVDQCFFQPATFTKEMLARGKVIGQVDKKFVACFIQESEISNCIPSDGLVVLFDQHAAHERVRLEQLISDVYEKDDTTGSSEARRIKRSDVRPPRTVFLTEEDVRLMQTFRDEFERIGVIFHVDEKCRDRVQIHTLPACMAQREANDRKRGKDPLNYVEIMIREHNQLLLLTAGTKHQLPAQVHKLLATHACKGAIKFGDQLNNTTCQELLSSLAACSLPFQCAHGRPSIAPLISLQQLSLATSHKRPPPSIWKFRQRMLTQAEKDQ